jgi:putative heme-binding domain-containing protein
MKPLIFVLIISTISFAQTEPEEKKPIEPLSKATADDLAKGKRTYLGHCSPCHGPSGNGGSGANLAQPRLARAPDDQSLFDLIKRGIPGTEMPTAWQMIDREIWQTAAFVKTLGHVPQEVAPGNASRGRLVYFGAGNCQACHTIQAVGGKLGPELGEIGLRRSASHLRRSLLEPETDLAEQFLYLRVTAKDGKSYSGVRLNEDTFSIQMMDMAENIRAFWKHELKQVVEMKGKTPMPSYKSTLTKEQIDDLVAFLVTLRGAK